MPAQAIVAATGSHATGAESARVDMSVSPSMQLDRFHAPAPGSDLSTGYAIVVHDVI
jgi:hypothetical protein